MAKPHLSVLGRMNAPMRQLIIVLSLLAALVTIGASSAPPSKAIRVVQEHEVWWFEDGSGRRFFSLGVNCVGGCYGHAEASSLAPARKGWIIDRSRCLNYICNCSAARQAAEPS